MNTEDEIEEKSEDVKKHKKAQSMIRIDFFLLQI